MNDRWQMVFDRVHSIMDFLDKKDAGQRTALHDSTVEQIRTMAQMVDTFNITRDPKIAELSRQLREAVSTIDPTQLKDADNQAARDRTRQGLQNVLDALPSLDQ